MNLTPLQGFLAALADSGVSAPFYAAAAYQLAILALGCSARVRATRGYAFAAGVSHVLLAGFLATGFYYATRPVA